MQLKSHSPHLQPFGTCHPAFVSPWWISKVSRFPYSDLLRQFRALDDGVTLRLNRSYARSRDDGTSAPPSLLQQHDKRFSSASALDLGKSTYASGSNSVCTAFWRELLDVWTHREDTIRYCIAVSQAARPKAPSNNPDDRLDMDRVVPPAEPSTWSRAENPIDFTVRGLAPDIRNANCVMS